MNWCYTEVERARKNALGLLAPGHSLLDSLDPFMQDTVPTSKSLPKDGKLHISMTKNLKNVVVSSYDSVDDLKQVQYNPCSVSKIDLCNDYI